jgi:hypothetical protein
MVSQSTSLDAEPTGKQPSSAVVNTQHPPIRDSAKKDKATLFVVEKVTKGKVKAVESKTPQSVDNPIMKSLQEGLMKANDIMQTMANHQVMSLAPQDVSDHYLAEVFDLINVQARSKRLCLQVKNEEPTVSMQKLEKEKGLLQMDTKMPAIGCGDGVKIGE